MDFAVPIDHWVNMKDNEKIDKYSYLAREFTEQWKVTEIPIYSLMVLIMIQYIKNINVMNEKKKNSNILYL